jgi:hypothetical protein
MLLSAETISMVEKFKKVQNSNSWKVSECKMRSSDIVTLPVGSGDLYGVLHTIHVSIQSDSRIVFDLAPSNIIILTHLIDAVVSFF